MSDQNKVDAAAAVAEQNGEESKKDTSPLTIYATKDEAEKAWTPTGKSKVFEIVKETEGKVEVLGYCWANGYNNACYKYTASLGIKARQTGGGSGTPSKAAVVKAAAEFTDEEFAAIVAARAAKVAATPVKVDTQTVKTPAGHKGGKK